MKRNNYPPLNGIESISMYLFIAIIIGVAIGLYIHVQRLKKQGNLINNRRQVEMFPSLVSTLGVLGTFIGISIGLLNFKPDELEESIPELLAGLKTAFFYLYCRYDFITCFIKSNQQII